MNRLVILSLLALVSGCGYTAQARIVAAYPFHSDTVVEYSPPVRTRTWCRAVLIKEYDERIELRFLMKKGMFPQPLGWLRAKLSQTLPQRSSPRGYYNSVYVPNPRNLPIVQVSRRVRESVWDPASRPPVDIDPEGWGIEFNQVSARLQLSTQSEG